MIQPGVDWNGFGPPPDLLGKKICYTCILKIFNWGPYRANYPSGRELEESILVLATVIAFLVALAAGTDRLFFGLLFVGSLGFVALERWLREQIRKGRPSARRKARENWKAWHKWRRNHPEPLVNLETIFETQTA